MNTNRLSKIVFALAAIGIGSLAQASYIAEIEANDTIGTAQYVGGDITIGNNPDPLIKPDHNAWVSISGTGNDTNDYYSFDANAGDVWNFDIDNAYDLGTDLEMFLYDLGGNLLASNDDGGNDPGSGGLGFDPNISYQFAAGGTYAIGVCAFNCFGDPGGITGSPVPTGATYDLHITRKAQVPEPSILALFGLGLAGVGFFGRRRRS